MSYENFLRAYNQSKSWLRPWSLCLEIHDQFYVLPSHPGMHTPGNFNYVQDRSCQQKFDSKLFSLLLTRSILDKSPHGPQIRQFVFKLDITELISDIAKTRLFVMNVNAFLET